jgi:hypothetical protein
MKTSGIFVLVAVACLFSAACRPREVEAKERKSVRSPNGRLQAKLAVLAAGDGATALRMQMIYVMPVGVNPKLTGQETGGYVAASIDACRDENIEVRWVSDDRIEIAFKQDRPSWVNFIPRVQGVSVALDDRAKEPNQPPEPTR